VNYIVLDRERIATETYLESLRNEFKQLVNRYVFQLYLFVG